MAQVVEANAPNASFGERFMELLDDASGLGGPTESIGEDETALLPFRARPEFFSDLALLVCSQLVYDHCRHYQRAPAPFCLRWHKGELAADPLELMAHPQRPSAE